MGKRRAYELGKFIRSRYGSYLSPKYNLSEIYIRSTDSTRTKMTVLVAMAAVYRPGRDSWSKEINWVPIPYTTVPLKYDFVSETQSPLLQPILRIYKRRLNAIGAFSISLPWAWRELALLGMNCPAFEDHIERMTTTNNAEMLPYKAVVNRLSSILGIDLTETPVLIYSAYDVYISQTHLRIPLRSPIEKIMPEIKKAADKAYDILFGNVTMLPLKAGLLLKEFFDLASTSIAGEPTQKIRIYSAHDINVYSFEAITKATPKQGFPMYASAFALELRKEKKTGKYIVVPLYLKSPEEKVQYLQIEGCGRPCYIEQFYTITKSSILDVNEWKSRCNYDENAPFDDKGYA